jgi:Flp pilus assembly protein TadD
MRYLAFPMLVLFVPLCWLDTAIACPKESGANFSSLEGTVIITPNDKKASEHPAKRDEIICEDYLIKVLPGSKASLVLPGPEFLSLNENTVFALKSIQPDKPLKMKVYEGFVNLINRTLNEIEVELDGIAKAMPLGTEFAFSVDKSKASVWVYEGSVKVFNEHGSVILKPGKFFAEVYKGQAPKIQIDIKPRDAVNWALYYPPIFPFPDASSFINNDIREAIRNYRQGHADVALAQLDSLSSEKQSSYFLKVRAAMRLSVGQEKLALQDIHALLARNPNDAEALALQSIRAITQNRKVEAYSLAKKAIAANPKSASAYSALSYSEQSRFDLDKALVAAEQTVKLAPHDAMVWARKAVLELALGLTSDSEQTAQKALSLDANLERTQTVKGFSNLLRLNTHKALENFNEAIKLDSTSPLARLGLGLAKIRDGNLKQGRKDIEIAANLDPNNSLIRSYLGKSYFEEKRTSLADNQFNLAKERDPKDPTPYFYSAIQKQSINRPVEALHDVEKAIELNDNRAVFRSSLHLDRDLAARSASQGRIYNDLGFQQLGLLEGWKSVNKDASNYSAHRLLADNYAALPRHELARVSEILQSQLLQPNNITPIQANLAETDLFVLNGLGPSDLSFNEFNPLFEYNRISLQTSGLYGGNNTWGDNVALSGIKDNVSFSLGQFHFESDGFRQNNFLKKDLYNAFVQAKVTDNLNLQAEYRHEDRSNGYLLSNFYQKFSPNFNEKTSLDSYRVGGRYAFNPSSSIIGSLIYQDVNKKRVYNYVDSDGDTVDFSNQRERNGFIAELQHIYDSSNLDMVSGFSHINQNGFLKDGFGINDTSPTRTNIYNYSKLSINNKLQVTVGVGVDLINIKNSFNRNRVNPKFGIEWTPSAKTTFRAATFRGMSINQTSSQTIEPTQVAGFNQLFDDPNGTLAWRYGAGIDHKFSKYIKSGLEYSERILNIPEVSTERTEQLARAYIYLTPIEQFSLSSEYYYERINQPLGSIGPFQLAESHRIPMTLSFFHPSGLALKIKNTFVHQSGLFASCVDCSQTAIPGNSNFYVVDLNLSYRIPRRYGIVSFGINNLFDSHSEVFRVVVASTVKS